MMGIKRWLGRALTIAMLLVALLAIGISVVAVSATHHGYRALTMQTGSMVPLIKPGDLVLVRRVAPETLQPGDIVSFAAPLGSGLLVTHRIISRDDSPAGPVFRTKGDRNDAADPWSFSYQASGWKVVRVLPGIGRLQALAQGTTGRLVATLGVFVVTLLLLWPAFAGPRPSGDTAKTSA